MTHGIDSDDFSYNGVPVNDLTADEFANLVGDIPDPDDSMRLPEPEPPHNPDNDYDNPDPLYVKPPPRKRSAGQYEKRLRTMQQTTIKYLVQHEATVPDAATLLMHGPEFCRAWGNAAADNDKIARAIDWFSAPTENTTAAALLATAPILLQLIRNHEPQLEPATRGFKLPFLKDSGGAPRYLRLRVGIKLTRLRPMTNDPDALARHTFRNPAVEKEFKRQGIDVAGYFRSTDK